MRRWRTAVTMAALIPALAGARAPDPAGWITSWGSAQMPMEDANALPAATAPGGVTLSHVVRLSAGGTRLRVRLSNAFGRRPLAIGGARIARPAAADAGTPLTFSGRPDALIPPGAELYADPVALPVAPGADLAISLYLPDPAAATTGHPGARTTGSLVPGDHAPAAIPANAVATTRWYGIADIEVADPRPAAPVGGTIVTIGDSITDGYGIVPDSNTRWPDRLAERLRAGASTRAIGVVNAGIGGNRVLLDGLGPNLVARFDRDVVARSGVRWAILLEGINDLGVLTRDSPATPAAHAALVAQVTAAYRQLAMRAQAHGIRLIGGTLSPMGGNAYYHPGPALEADRQAINRFIRTSGTFDAVIDFDRVLRDPAHPDRLAARYDSGDHLHPSPAGYRAMADAVPLTLFTAPADPRPAIALTFDDLPAHGPLAPGETRVGVIRAITAALAAAGAPAHGFYNAAFGQDDPAGAAAAIAAWRAAGLPLGNHSYSHVDLAKVGPAAFAADVARNEASLAAAAPAGSDWHWFRYPFLSEGGTPAVTAAARADLHARGYRAAAVTMGFNDFDWNAPHAACAARGDTAALARLDAGFLADARTAALDARARAQAQLGRDIPYVLLLHAGAMDARLMPRLLAQYRAMGFRFVTLAAAQADPYYAAANDLSLPGPTPSLAGAPGPTRLAGPPAGLCSRTGE